MDLHLACLLVVIFMPYMVSVVNAYFRINQFGAYDFADPRGQAQSLAGVGQRLDYAQKNCWESSIIFTAVIVYVEFSHSEPDKIAVPAFCFVGLRVLYVIAYALGYVKLRIAASALGILSCLWMLNLS